MESLQTISPKHNTKWRSQWPLYHVLENGNIYHEKYSKKWKCLYQSSDSLSTVFTKRKVRWYCGNTKKAQILYPSEKDLTSISKSPLYILLCWTWDIIRNVLHTIIFMTMYSLMALKVWWVFYMLSLIFVQIYFYSSNIIIFFMCAWFYSNLFSFLFNLKIVLQTECLLTLL